MKTYTKIITWLALITSVMCVITCVAEKDTSEAFAWGIIALYNGRELAAMKE